jgi:hypothetical protein
MLIKEMLKQRGARPTAMMIYLRQLSRDIHIEHSNSPRALRLPPEANLAHCRGLSLEWLQTTAKSCIMGICAEPGYQIPLAIMVEVAATRRLQVGEGNGLEHGNTTSMMPHVLEIDSIQVLAHAD